MIDFTSDYDGFDLKNRSKYGSWLKDVIEEEGKISGEVHYVFCNDDLLLSINEQFLNHHDYTDIITFSLSEIEDIIRGEIYISIDRVKENAILNSVNFEKELARVIVHGVLHLVGYNDHSKEEKIIMRAKEDYYIILLSK